MDLFERIPSWLLAVLAIVGGGKAIDILLSPPQRQVLLERMLSVHDRLGAFRPFPGTATYADNLLHSIPGPRARAGWLVLVSGVFLASLVLTLLHLEKLHSLSTLALVSFLATSVGAHLWLVNALLRGSRLVVRSCIRPRRTGPLALGGLYWFGGASLGALLSLSVVASLAVILGIWPDAVGAVELNFYAAARIKWSTAISSFVDCLALCTVPAMLPMLALGVVTLLTAGIASAVDGSRLVWRFLIGQLCVYDARDVDKSYRPFTRLSAMIAVVVPVLKAVQKAVG